MDDKCYPRAIFNMSECNFHIPAYQRGYRWLKQQVIELLNDIWDFSKSKGNGNKFYCLQPVIVKSIKNKENEEVWEVIDGQQRLTTIHLILTYLNSILPEKEKQFSIDYETREKSKLFLESIDEELSDDNIDFYHMFNAYTYIKTWFEEKQITEEVSKNALVMRLVPVFNEDVKVIWYEVDSQTNSNDVFTRVNMGKIPLTNAELIKALLLRSGNFDNNVDLIRIRQLEIANEWDRIEYALQNEEFWYFLTNTSGSSNFTNRIDFIFQLMAKEKNKTFNIKIVEVELLPFHVFNEWFTEIGDPNRALEEIWKEIKKYFLTFEEWYQDRNLYHLIGFLITSGVSIAALKDDSLSKTKTDFVIHLNKLIRQKVNFRKVSSRRSYKLEDLDYSNSYDKNYIRNILLLFNIITLNDNRNANSRFPYKSYKQEQWDLEHIHALKSQISEREHEKLEWIEFALEDLSKIIDMKLIEECNSVIQSGSTEKYDLLIDKILSQFAENGQHEEVNNISNIVLLDADTNRSYGNAVFLSKRKKILEKDKRGVFIPQCTKNVFLKYYNLVVEQLSLWNKTDRESYLNNIKIVLSNYLPNEEV
jgi:hypothetical protein